MRQRGALSVVGAGLLWLLLVAACGSASAGDGAEQDHAVSSSAGPAASGPTVGTAAAAGTSSSGVAAGSGATPASSGASAARPAAASGAGPTAGSGASVGAAAAAIGANANEAGAKGPAPAGAGAGASSAGAGAVGSADGRGPQGTSHSAAMAAGAGAPPAAGSGVDPASCKGDQPGSAPVIYVIGDSTASVYEANLYPRMGWAQPLQEYFKEACATVQDKALSGRSSKSFLDEGAWAPIRAALHEGDFVLIQFGHNDEKREDAARYTEPFGSYQEHLSLYIDDTLAAKATPILMTSIERNKWSNGKLSATHGDYPEAVRQLAQTRQLTLVDMTQLTHDYLEGIGQEAATKLFMNLAPGESPNYPNGNSDDTHLQDKGAHKVAEIALAELARQRTPIAARLEHVPTP